MNSEAKIAIVLQDGKIVIKSQIKNLSKGELALLIQHLEMLKDDLKDIFKKGFKRFEE